MKWAVIALLLGACLCSMVLASDRDGLSDLNANALAPSAKIESPEFIEIEEQKPRKPQRGSSSRRGSRGDRSQSASRSSSGSKGSGSKQQSSKAKVKLPAGMSPRRALTGGVSWALTRIQPLLFNISRMAARLSRTSGVPLSDEGRDARLDQDMKAAGVSFAEIEELAGHRIQAEESVEATAIPASYDFFAENPQCALPARFQGMCGSCVTFAVTNSLAHRLCKKGVLKKHLSVPYVLGCTAPPQTNYTPMAMCASPTDPLDLVPVLQQGVYEDSCLKDREALYQCALFPPLLEMIDQFPASFVSIADKLPCVSKWRKDKLAPQPSPAQSREQACPLSPPCGPKYKLTHIHGLTAPPNSDAEVQQWMRTIQREIITHGPVPAIISETPEQLYNYKSGVFSYTKPGSAGGSGSKKEGDLTSLFLTTAHAISIVGWGELNGQPYWKIENSWSSQWGDKGFFLLARGKNMLGIESMAFALRTDGSGPVNYLAELKLTKIMFPFLGMIQLTLARKRTFSPRLSECVRMLHTLRTLLKVSGNDGAKKVASDKLVSFLVPFLGLKMGGEQNIAMSFQLLMMADSDIEDVSLLSSAGLTEALPALRTFAGAKDPSKLTEAEVLAAKAFIADHRAAVLIFTGEDPNIPYANTKDGFKRTFFVKRAEAEPTPQSIRDFVNKHFSFLQKTVQYKLKKAGKL